MADNKETVESVRTKLRFIYNSYRTALLNRKYYGRRLKKYQQYNTAVEILIAFGATGSGGVAGLAIWGSIRGQYAWLMISTVAAVLGVIKPILQYGRHIENYTKLYAGHGSVYLDLRSMVEDIQVSKTLPSELTSKYETIKNRVKSLSDLDDPAPDTVLIREIQNEVNKEIPAESLWEPKTVAGR